MRCDRRARTRAHAERRAPLARRAGRRRAGDLGCARARRVASSATAARLVDLAGSETMARAHVAQGRGGRLDEPRSAARARPRDARARGRRRRWRRAARAVPPSSTLTRLLQPGLEGGAAAALARVRRARRARRRRDARDAKFARLACTVALRPRARPRPSGRRRPERDAPTTPTANAAPALRVDRRARLRRRLRARRRRRERAARAVGARLGPTQLVRVLGGRDGRPFQLSAMPPINFFFAIDCPGRARASPYSSDRASVRSYPTMLAAVARAAAGRRSPSSVACAGATLASRLLAAKLCGGGLAP